MILWLTLFIIAANLLLAWRFGLSEARRITAIRDANRPATATEPAHGSATAPEPARTPEAPKPAEAAAPVAAAGPAGKSGGTATPGGSVVMGTVVLTGSPPAEKAITPITADPLCSKLYTAPPMTRNYVTGAGGGLANVFVYVKTGLEGKTFPVPTEPALVDQVGCLYVPYVVGAMAGQTVNIRNSDPLMHNVNFASSTAGNKVFNFVQATKGQVNPQQFAKPEVLVKLQCNVHPWMFGYVGVVGHPYYAVTDADGKFKLPPGLPAGDYVLEFVHLKTGRVQVPVKTGPEGGATVSTTMAVPAP